MLNVNTNNKIKIKWQVAVYSCLKQAEVLLLAPHISCSNFYTPINCKPLSTTYTTLKGPM